GHRKAPLHLRGPRRRRRADRDRQGSDPRLADVPNIRLHPRTRLPRGLVREVAQRKRETLAAAGRLLRRRLRNFPLTSTALLLLASRASGAATQAPPRAAPAFLPERAVTSPSCRVLWKSAARDRSTSTPAQDEHHARRGS